MRIRLPHGGEADGDLLSVRPLIVRVGTLAHLNPEVVRPAEMALLPLVVDLSSGPAVLVGLGLTFAWLEVPGARFPLPISVLPLEN
jgi:hypothetical protein